MGKEEKKNWEQIGRAVYEEWANRPAFSYTPTRDPAYTAARDAAVREANRAAADAEARAAAKTGGYGNSYASYAGSAAYESSMRSLDDVIPKLYDLAYGRYVDEGEELRARMREANEYAEREAKEAREEEEREEAARKEAADKEKEEQEAAQKAESERQKQNKALLASSLWPMGYNPDDVTVPNGDWYGVNENEAVAVMLKGGVADHVVEGLVSRAAWARHKTYNDPNGIYDPSTYGYASYDEYLRAYVNMALDMTR